MYLTSSLSDGGKEDRSPKKLRSGLMVVLVIIVMTIGISILIIAYSDSGYWVKPSVIENESIRGTGFIDEKERERRCKQLLHEADVLVRKYDNNRNVTEWSQIDRINVFEIELLYQENCLPSNQQTMTNLKKCTIFYITIESLIDKMEERQLDTLPLDEQRAYNTSYKEYFDNFCNIIIDEIKRTDEFMEFNKTRGK